MLSSKLGRLIGELVCWLIALLCWPTCHRQPVIMGSIPSVKVYNSPFGVKAHETTSEHAIVRRVNLNVMFQKRDRVKFRVVKSFIYNTWHTFPFVDLT